MFDEILNWRLLPGSHPFPGPDGGTCINEAAIVAAGFPYRRICDVREMPRCFSRVISSCLLALNDQMTDSQRELLLPFVVRLSGTADTDAVERKRADFLALQAVNVFAAIALEFRNMPDHAAECRAATDLGQAYRAISGAAKHLMSGLEAPCLVVDAALQTAYYATCSPSAASAILIAESATRAMFRTFVVFRGSDAAVAEALGAVIAAIEGILAIGRQGGVIPLTLAADRMNTVKSCAESRAKSRAKFRDRAPV